MSQIRFEWDPRKAKSNEKKHGVSFEEAQAVFFDEQALLFEDPSLSMRNSGSSSSAWVPHFAFSWWFTPCETGT